MSYRLVEDLQQKAISVSQACRVLNVSRSGYYAAAKRHPAPLSSTRSVYRQRACEDSLHSPRRHTYGSRRLRTALCTQGLTMGRHRLRCLVEAVQFRTAIKQRVDNNFVLSTGSGATRPYPGETPPFVHSLTENFTRGTHK